MRRENAWAAALVVAAVFLAACSDSSGESCRGTGSPSLEIGQPTEITVERAGNVWKSIDVDGQGWNFQARGPSDVPNGSHQATVTLKDALTLEVVLPGHEPVLLDRVGCA